MSIEVRNLSKRFVKYENNKGFIKNVYSYFSPKRNYKYALRDLSFKINDGEIVGYLGKNGAGKSTTIKILSGIMKADDGICLVDDRTPWINRKEHVQTIGVVFGQKSNLWWDLPVIDSFNLLNAIYKIPKSSYEKNLSYLAKELDIIKLLDQPVRTLSLGQRMRCEIAASLLHSPKILFLDEPTIGLDALSKKKVRAFIKKLNKTQNTTIILTTHDTQDLEALVDRILFIDEGKILFDGTIPELKLFSGDQNQSLDDILIGLYQMSGDD